MTELRHTALVTRGAMGEAYARQGLINDSPNPVDVSAARWEAMARAYE